MKSSVNQLNPGVLQIAFDSGTKGLGEKYKKFDILTFTR
jgi:hypothetical protein